jgi:hypothetical protein
LRGRCCRDDRADSLDLREKRGELLKRRDNEAQGYGLSCRKRAKDLARSLIGQGNEAVARCEGERWLLTKPVLGSSGVMQKRMDLCRKTKQEAGRDASLLGVRSDGNASGRSW